MTRLLENFLRGNIDTAVTSTDTTLSSPNFADLPVISSPDIMALVLDPLATAPEIVHVTDHAADSTNVTVTRGEENTSAASHDVDTAWVHAATDFDYVPIDRTNIAQGSLLQVKNTNPLELEHLDSGTYRKPLPIDFAPPHSWGTVSGSPAFGEYASPVTGFALDRQAVLCTADGAANDMVAIPMFIPATAPSWVFNVYWVYAGTSTGDVRVRGWVNEPAAQSQGDDFNNESLVNILDSTVTDPGQHIMQVASSGTRGETGWRNFVFGSWGTSTLTSGENIHLLHAELVEA